MMRTVFTIIYLLVTTNFLIAQVSVAPIECYPNYSSIDEMNAMAASSGGDLPFATWKAAYDYAIANNISTIDFATSTYYPGGIHGNSSEWGDASGGFELVAGMTVNGNGSVIDNSLNDNALAFATITGNNATLDGFTFIEFTGNNTGAVGVSPNLTGWSIIDCNFDHCDWAGDGLLVDLGTSGNGSLINCNFYNHIQSTGSAMTVEGSGGTLNVTDCNYTCNLRIAAGGAVKIEEAVVVNFTGCKFSGNEANASIGGAVVIRNNAIVTFDQCEFTCNLTSGGTTWDGGALAIESGSTVTITDSNFVGNGGDGSTSSPVGPADGVGDPTYGQTRYGGAIYVSSASASMVSLIITGTTFENNLATSRGGAIRIRDLDNSVSQISDCYFSGNDAPTGSAISFETQGPTVISTFDSYLNNFSDNTFTGNLPSTSTIYTEYDLYGSGNEILGDIVTTCGNGDGTSGDSPEPAFLNFKGDYFESNLGNWTPLTGTTTSYSGGKLTIDHADKGAVYRDVSSGPLNQDCAYNTTLSSNSETVTWTFTAVNSTGLEGWDGVDDGMAFVLGCTESDFFSSTANGYAVVFDNNNSGNLQLSYFTGGMTADANFTPVISSAGTGSSNSGFSVRITYNPSGNSWTIDYDYSVGSSSASDVDPRMDSGVNCIGPDNTASGTDGTYTSTDLPYTGFAMSGSCAITVDHYHTRLGTGCDTGPGASVSASNLLCYGCDTSPTVDADCADQGSISGVLWNDGDAASADGQEDASYISGATVSLYTSSGTLIATVTTGADGKYFFGGLPDGEYYVQFTLPTGYLGITYQDTGAVETDSDVNSTTLQSPVVTITTNGSSGTNSSSTEDQDGTSGAAHYTNIDAGFTTEVLPVELKTFYGKSQECNVILRWVTAWELNNEHFVIQRSYDAKSFEDIARVKGKFVKDTETYYEYEDMNQSKELIYYRLKQVDTDGKLTLSDVEMVSNRGCDFLQSINVFPVPASDRLNIELSQRDEVNIEVFDFLGKLLYSRLILGSHHIIDTDFLKNGVYLLKISGKDSNYQKVTHFEIVR